MNWLQRARRELNEGADAPPASPAEGPLPAALGARPPLDYGSIGSNGSAPPWQMLESDTLREECEERAAIMEFDGNLTREEAERAAWTLVSTRYRLH